MPRVTSSSLPAEVEMNTTPRTRSTNSSGYSSASAMIVMPPIECPIRTTGPFAGTVWSITSLSASPRPSNVYSPRRSLVDRPCPGWS